MRQPPHDMFFLYNVPGLAKWCALEALTRFNWSYFNLGMYKKVQPGESPL